MTVSIHQPHYLPWLRYFEKIARSDVFVLLDDAQYEKNGYQNRNRVKTSQGSIYLTVPVLRPTLRPIREIAIDRTGEWRRRHRRTIEMSYGKAPWFEQYWPELAPVYEQDWTHLADLNEAMLAIFLQQLRIETPVKRSSDLGPAGSASERIAGICARLGADTYLSGAHAAEAYLDPSALARAGVRLALQEWRAPVYRQQYPSAGFLPDLSILDLLFNEGPASREILLHSGGVREAAEC